MNYEVKEEQTFRKYFDRSLFGSLDKCLGKNLYSATEIMFDSGRAVNEDGLFSDIEHPLGNEISATSEKGPTEGSLPMESPPMESPIPTPGTCETKINDGNFSYIPCQEKPAVHSTPRKKRKRPLVTPSTEESDEFKSQLYSMLESSSRVLTAHVESHNLNSQLDRNQRKEHAESLVCVLGKLADALGKIADRL